MSKNKNNNDLHGQINNFKVKPIALDDEFNKQNTRNYDLFNYPYCNLAVCGTTTAGKSTIIYNLLQKIARKGTKIFLFCSTINHDALYKKMIEMLEDKGCTLFVQESFIDDENQTNYVEEIIKTLNEEAAPKEESSNEKQQPVSLLFSPPSTDQNVEQETEKDKEIRLEKKRKKAPKIIFLFDDLSDIMRDKSIFKLASKMRHFKAMAIYSVHNIVNLAPNALRMMHYCICLNKQSPDKISELANKLGISFDKDKGKQSYLEELYRQCCEGSPYNFMLIDRKNNKFRKNFDQVIY